MQPREAFLVGYLTSTVGVPFRGIEVLNAVGVGASPPLVQQIIAQADAFRAGNAQTRDDVLRVEALLAKNQLPTPVKPRTLEEYVTWSRDASVAAGKAFPNESLAAAALLVGGFFGDLLAAVQLELILVQLEGVAPEHAPLAKHAAEEAGRAARAVERLGLAKRHPALPEPARAPIAGAIAGYDAVSAAAKADVATRTSVLSAYKRDLNANVNPLLDLF
jgi:hypothetical protein